MFTKDTFRRNRNKKLFISFTTSGLARLTGFISNLIIIPLTLNYLGTELFGLWAVIISLSFLYGFVDFGIGNSLINIVADSAEEKNNTKIKAYVSNAFYFLFIISLILIVALLILDYFTPVESLLNLKRDYNNILGDVVIYGVVLIIIQAPLSVAQKVALGFQELYIYNLWEIAGKITAAVFVFISVSLDAGFTILVLSYFSAQVLALLGNFVHSFFLRHSDIMPSMLLLNFEIIKKISSRGSLFFLFGVAFIIGGSIDNILILNYLNPDSVTLYDVPLRLLSFVPALTILITQPLWPAARDAMAAGDHNWLKSSQVKIFKSSSVIAVVSGAVFIFFGNEIIHLWTSNEFNMTYFYRFSIALWILVITLRNIVVTYMNAFDLIKIQTILMFAASAAALIAKLLLLADYGLTVLIWINIVCFLLIMVTPEILMLNLRMKKLNYKAG